MILTATILSSGPLSPTRALPVSVFVKREKVLAFGTMGRKNDFAVWGLTLGKRESHENRESRDYNAYVLL